MVVNGTNPELTDREIPMSSSTYRFLSRNYGRGT